MIVGVDHLGIAVKDLEAQIRLYRDALGLEFLGVEAVPSQQVRVAFFRAGETHIELLESTTPDGPIAGAIAKRGEGLHHLAYQVDDIRSAIADAAARGLSVIGDGARPGAHGALTCFLHPKTTGGVLTELVERTTSD